MVAKQWREHLVNKLQDHYGLSEEEALKKAEAWIDWFNNGTERADAQRERNRGPGRI
jgi:hypothetical protein